MKRRIQTILLAFVLIVTMIPAISVAALTKGDADGNNKITAADARFTLRCSVNLETPTAAQLSALDINNDGMLTAADARTVLRRSVGLVSDKEWTGNDSSSSLSICLDSEPDTLDPALNSAMDGATIILHLFSGLAKWSQDKNGNLIVTADCAEKLVEGVTNKDGTVTYTYKLRDGLKWSDGKTLTAYDFEFAWNRAASPQLEADYSYMFDVIKGYYEMWATDLNDNFIYPNAKLAVEAKDNRTLVVTLNSDVPYWNQLLAFPTYFPVREDVVRNEDWEESPSTFVCNGPYIISDRKHNKSITLTKNKTYIDADEITMSELRFRLSDDVTQMLKDYKNGDLQFIDDMPYYEINNLKKNYPDEFAVEGQMGTYYACWNINTDILPAYSNLTGASAERARTEIRNAINLLFDRTYLVEKILQEGQVPASSLIPMGITEPDGTQFYKNANSTKDSFDGYFDTSSASYAGNVRKAVSILKKYYTFNSTTGKFTNFPAIKYLYNESTGHKAIAEYLAAALGSIGITIKPESVEWSTFLTQRTYGNYQLARNGWVADYNDPINFLDMWTTYSGNNCIQFGYGNHRYTSIYNLDLTPYGYNIKVNNGTWAETYDVLISTIKNCKNSETRYKLMHLAEDMVMSTGCIIPLYYYTDIYMLDNSVDGFFSTPFGYKYFMYCTVN